MSVPDTIDSKLPAALSPSGVESSTPAVTPSLIDSSAPSISPSARTKWLRWMNTGLPYPGKFEDISKESREVLGTAEFFDGLRLESSRGLSENFQIGHNVNFGGSENQAGYQFMTTIAKRNTTVVGRYDAAGRVFGRLHQVITPSISGMVTSQVQMHPEQANNMSFELDYTGSDNSAQLRFEPKGYFGLSYMQSIHPNVSGGTEILHLSAQGITLMTAGLRYNGTSSSVAFTANTMLQTGLSYCYRPTKQKAELVTELTVSPSQQSDRWDSVWSAGFRTEYKTARFRALVTNTGTVGAFMEESINQFMRLSMCADMDYKKNSYKFGFGLTMAI